MAQDLGKAGRERSGGSLAGSREARAAETALTGKPLDERTAAQAARAVLAGAMPFSKNAYKLPLFETLVRRALLTAVAGT